MNPFIVSLATYPRNTTRQIRFVEKQALSANGRPAMSFGSFNSSTYNARLLCRLPDEESCHDVRARLDELLNGMNRIEFMVRFVIADPALDTTIIGTKNLDHVRDNVAAARKGPFPADVVAEAKHRLDATGSRPASNRSPPAVSALGRTPRGLKVILLRHPTNQVSRGGRQTRRIPKTPTMVDHSRQHTSRAIRRFHGTGL
jgi:hypothetical protein